MRLSAAGFKTLSGVPDMKGKVTAHLRDLTFVGRRFGAAEQDLQAILEGARETIIDLKLCGIMGDAVTSLRFFEDFPRKCPAPYCPTSSR